MEFRVPEASKRLVGFSPEFNLVKSLLSAVPNCRCRPVGPGKDYCHLTKQLFPISNHLPPQSRAEAAVPNSTAAVAALGANPFSSFDVGLLHFDPATAVRPDPKLTPDDVFPDATAEDVCTPGWATNHRYVAEEMRGKVYQEYGRTEGVGCCEVDHLVPLELGGSNDIKNRLRRTIPDRAMRKRINWRTNSPTLLVRA